MKKDLASGFALPVVPKRTPVDDEDGDRFAETGEVVSKQEKPKRVKKVGAKLRKNEEAGERVVSNLPSELVTNLRVRCARERRSISNAVATAVERWLKTG